MPGAYAGGGGGGQKLPCLSDSYTVHVYYNVRSGQWILLHCVIFITDEEAFIFAVLVKAPNWKTLMKAQLLEWLYMRKALQRHFSNI